MSRDKRTLTGRLHHEARAPTTSAAAAMPARSFTRPSEIERGGEMIGEIRMFPRTLDTRERLRFGRSCAPRFG